MMGLLRIFAILALLLTNACASNYKIPDLCPAIELPASERGFEVCSVSKKERFFSKKEWNLERKKRISLSFKDWSRIKKDYLQKCHKEKCNQVTTFFDKLFISIDKGLGAVYEVR